MSFCMPILAYNILTLARIIIIIYAWISDKEPSALPQRCGLNINSANHSITITSFLPYHRLFCPSQNSTSCSHSDFFLNRSFSDQWWGQILSALIANPLVAPSSGNPAQSKSQSLYSSLQYFKALAVFLFLNHFDLVSFSSSPCLLCFALGTFNSLLILGHTAVFLTKECRFTILSVGILLIQRVAELPLSLLSKQINF